MSNTKAEFIARVAKVQVELKSPKSQYNSFGKYHFRNQEDILESVKPLLNGLVLKLSDEMVEVGGRIYVKATATITDGVHELTNTAFAREAEEQKGMQDSMLTGATSSFARKYCLNGLFLIDDTKDADATHDFGKGKVEEKSSPLTKKTFGKSAEKVEVAPETNPPASEPTGDTSTVESRSFKRSFKRS